VSNDARGFIGKYADIGLESGVEAVKERTDCEFRESIEALRSK
jgi:hypothetical protein